MILKIYSVTVTVTIKRGKRKQILKCKNHGHSFMIVSGDKNSDLLVSSITTSLVTYLPKITSLNIVFPKIWYFQYFCKNIIVVQENYTLPCLLNKWNCWSKLEIWIIIGNVANCSFPGIVSYLKTTKSWEWCWRQVIKKNGRKLPSWEWLRVGTIWSFVYPVCLMFFCDRPF